MNAEAAQRVRDLIMILNEGDELRWFKAERGRPSPLPLPFIALSLVEVTPFRGRNKFLRRTFVVRVVRFSATRERDHRRVMKIVVPQ